MKRWSLVWIAALVTVIATACGGSNAGGDIVVTTNILGDVVRTVVGDAAEVRVLMKPNADPHSFGVSAQDAASMNSAGLIVYNGLGLEENVIRNLSSAADEGVSTLSVGDHIEPIRYAEGDSAGTPDPHFWTDPERMIAAVDVIEQTIVREVDGIDTDAVAANAELYREQLRQLDRSMTDSFAAI